MAATGHWRLWIMIRSFSSTYPNTSSPGIGWQHSAMIYFFCKLSSVSLSTCFGLIFFFFLRLFFFLLLFIVAERESQIFLPVTGLLFFQFILIRFSQDDCFAANGGQQFFFILGIMQFAQLLNNGFFRADFLFFKNSLRISSPIFWFALRSLRRMAAILARARAVVAKLPIAVAHVAILKSGSQLGHHFAIYGLTELICG